MYECLKKEIVLRKDYLTDNVETIYFGGGTPSLFSKEQILGLIQIISQTFSVSNSPEITLEANPDDLTEEKLHSLKAAGINRLSIGIQSFRDADLVLMNRAHSSKEALESVKRAQSLGFENITIDLIYSIPGLSDEDWIKNLEQATELNVPHISAYTLTVEEKTALHRFIKEGKIAAPDEGSANRQFHILHNFLEEKGYEHYEISNFAKPGWESKHNSSYWKGKPYLGIGPSAHSFNGTERSWNVANNARYINSLSKDILPSEKEILSNTDSLNEYIMVSLRTKWGLDLDKMEEQFGKEKAESILSEAEKFIRSRHLIQEGNKLFLTKEGMIISDHISSSLFI